MNDFFKFEIQTLDNASHNNVTDALEIKVSTTLLCVIFIYLGHTRDFKSANKHWTKYLRN